MQTSNKTLPSKVVSVKHHVSMMQTTDKQTKKSNIYNPEKTSVKEQSEITGSFQDRLITSESSPFSQRPWWGCSGVIAMLLKGLQNEDYLWDGKHGGTYHQG